MRYLEPATSRGYDAPHGLSDEAAPAVTTQALAAEICQRLVEWAEVEGGAILRPADWLVRCGKLYTESPVGFWLYITSQTGNSETIAKSLEQLARDACSKKQGVHQNVARALEKIDAVFPGLGAAMREQALHHRKTYGRDDLRGLDRAEDRAEVEAGEENG